MARISVESKDSNGAMLIPEKSIVRYSDIEWLYHGAYYSTTRETTDMLISSLHTDKMVILHDRDIKAYNGVVLVRTEGNQ